MEEPQQSLPTQPEPQAPRASHTGLVVAVIVLSIMVVGLAATTTWFFLRDSAARLALRAATSTVTDTATDETDTETTIIASANGTLFSVTYPDTWRVVNDGYTRLTPATSVDSAIKTEVVLSGTMPQSAGCALLTSDFTINYYDTAPIDGWSGNSYVGLYQTDGTTWCFLSSVAATKDTASVVGQTADKLYLQGASKHPSIDTTASNGDQIYVYAYKTFTSEADAKQFVMSDEYAEQKAIIQSLVVVR